MARIKENASHSGERRSGCSFAAVVVDADGFADCARPLVLLGLLEPFAICGLGSFAIAISQRPPTCSLVGLAFYFRKDSVATFKCAVFSACSPEKQMEAQGLAIEPKGVT